MRPPGTANEAAAIEIAGYEAAARLHLQEPVRPDRTAEPLEPDPITGHDEIPNWDLASASPRLAGVEMTGAGKDAVWRWRGGT